MPLRLLLRLFMILIAYFTLYAARAGTPTHNSEVVTLMLATVYAATVSTMPSGFTPVD